MWTNIRKCKIAAITYDKAILGLLVGSVLLAMLRPIGAKVLVLLTISSCRMWSAWECFWWESRESIEASPVNRRAERACLLGVLVANLLHLLTVWFTLRINHHGWFSLVRTPCELRKIKANIAGRILVMRSRRSKLVFSPDLGPLPSEKVFTT